MTLSTPEDRWLQLSGINARYWQCGSGPPLVLLHGIGGSLEAWYRNILAARSLQPPAAGLHR